MAEDNSIKNLKESIQKAMELSKCRKCGCMKESLKTMKSELFKTKSSEFSDLLNQLESSLEKMEPSEYT